MTIGELVVKIAADTSAMRRDLAAARAEIEGFGASVRGSSGDLDKMGRSTTSLGNDVKKTRGEFDKWESHIPIVGGMLDKLNRDILQGTGDLLGMIPGLEGVGNAFTSMAPAMAPVMSLLEIGPALFFAVAFAANFLADTLGVLLAVVGDLIAPLGVVTGLLGGLAAAFVIGAKKAADGGGKLQGFANKLDTLKSMFGKTARELAGDFLPLLNQLATDAQHALLFVDKLAHMPLAQAMRTAARQGIPALQKFMEQMGHIVAKPIRLAIQIAFGQTQAGNEASTFVSNMWNQFTKYWLGYTKNKRVFVGGHWVLEQKTVDGALQPFLDWFNRHDFTAQGKKIGHTIMQGIEKIEGPLSTLLGHIFLDAAGKAGKDLPRALLGGFKEGVQGLETFFQKFFFEIPDKWARRMNKDYENLMRKAFSVVVGVAGNAWKDIRQDASGVLHGIATIARTQAGSMAQVTKSLLSDAWNAVRHAAGSAWSGIKSAASGAVGSIAGRIRSGLNSAWNSVVGAAQHVWDRIVSIFTAPLHINIDWPPIPSGLSGILHKVPGLATGGMVTPNHPYVVGERGPELFVPSGAGSIVPNHRSFGPSGGGGGDTYLIFPNVIGLDRQAARQLARDLQPHLGRQVILRSQ